MQAKLETLSQQLEKVYQSVHLERMQGVPVINDKLQVKAIDFKVWQNNYLGVLITPWFMNITLLPNDSDTNGSEEQGHWQDITVGQEITHVFPSGRYTFVVGFEDDIGYYQSCSLFSPMFEFESQDAAELTAKAALSAVFDEEHEDLTSQHPAKEIEKIWHGEVTAKPQDAPFDGDAADDLINKKSLEEKLKEPISRRDFLRGRVLNHEDATDKPNEP